MHLLSIGLASNVQVCGSYRLCQGTGGLLVCLVSVPWSGRSMVAAGCPLVVEPRVVSEV